MRLVAPAAIVLCAALLLAGCGGDGAGGPNTTAPPAGGGGNGGGAPNSGGAGAGTPKKATAPNAPAGSKVLACEESAADLEDLRATAVDCGTARATMLAWRRTDSCALAAGASRGSCSLGDFRCQTVMTDRGTVVSCARPGAAVSFITR